MRKLINFLVSVLLLGSGHAVAEDAKPPMPLRDAIGMNYSGTVTEVTKRSITILWRGEVEPKPFVASEVLASGDYPKRHRDRLDGTLGNWLVTRFCYRLADVKIGDKVDIIYSHLGETDFCDAICIVKRPCGRVPPLPEDAEPNESIRYHERANVRWDFEDRGIPYPEKFGPNPRLLAAVLPDHTATLAWLQEKYGPNCRFPVAPMPREANTRAVPAINP